MSLVTNIYFIKKGEELVELNNTNIIIDIHGTI